MTGLWDIGKSRRKAVDEYVEEYRDRFEQNQEKDVPLHPHNLRMKIQDEEDLGQSREDTKRKEALRTLARQYKSRWEEKKQNATPQRD